ASRTLAAFDAVGNGPDGGPGVAHRAGARPVKRPPFALPSGAQRSTGYATVEPSLGVARDGTLFFLGLPPESPGSAGILRSTDCGRRWKVLPRGDTNGG